MRRIARGIVMVFAAVSLTAVFSGSVDAIDAQSTSFKLSESSIGAGSTVQSSSSNFKASDAVGDLTVGNSSSTNFQANSGNKTPNDPNLAVSITSGNIAFPNFSAATASVATATFSVLNYTSYGYVVLIAGTTPTNGTKTIPAMGTSTPAASSPGTEQFGINLVANTSPTSFGANPNNGNYGFGSTVANYNTPNSFRYVNGETIAQATKSSGITNYTISYVINVAGLTPGGQYTTNQTLIVTGTY
jgi:hypothetical protein